MKEDDKVRLIVEKEKYARYGFHKGMDGTICDPRVIDGTRLVWFWPKDMPVEYVEVKEEDLEVIWEAPERKVGVTVLFLSEKEVYKKQGITNGMFGIICEQCKDKEYYNVKFELPDGSEKIATVYYNDMIPIRDDEVEAYRQEVARELELRKNGR